MKKEIEQNKGITLISLIITIVVMLILVAVSVNVIIKSNLLGIADKAVNKYKTAAEEESNFGGLVIDGVKYETIEDYAKGGAAKIGNVLYPTLQEAINNVPADNTQKTIVLLRNIYENTNIPENKNIILDLDNYTIKCDVNSKPVIETNGKVTISNGKVTGEGLGEKNATIKVNQSGELTIVNSNIDGPTEKRETVELYGKLNMKSGKITNEKSNAICTYEGYNSSIIIENGTLTSDSSTTIYLNSGTFVMEEGEISNSTNNAVTMALKADGEAIIKGGKFVSKTNAVRSYGKLTIEGGEFNGTGNNIPTIGLESNSETIIRGGTITSQNSHTVRNYGKLTIEGGELITNSKINVPTIYLDLNSETIIKGGTIISQNHTPVYNRGKLIIEGGTFNKNSEKFPTIWGVEANSETIIRGGTITSQKSYIVYNRGNLTIENATIIGVVKNAVVNQGNFKLDGGTIEYTGVGNEGVDERYKNAIYNSGTMEINSGIVKSSTIAINQSNGTANINGGEIQGKGKTIEITGGTLNINNGTIESTEFSGGTSMALSMSNACIVNFKGGTLKTIDSMSLGAGSTFNHYGGTITKTGTTGDNFTGEGTYNDNR